MTPLAICSIRRLRAGVSVAAIAACGGMVLASHGSAQQASAPNAQLASPAIAARVQSLLSRMTLDEKVGQLVQYSAGSATGPKTSNESYEELAAQGRIGALLNVIGAERANHFQHIAVEKSRLHIPLLFGLDVIHGDHTTFPIPLAIAASWDTDAAKLVARTGAQEARADGVNWVFSPMVDIARDARWGRIVESNGEDPYLGAQLARAWVEGYQQGDLAKPDSVAASVKHFAAYGAAIAGRDYNAVDMSELTLRETYLAPYRAAVDAGVATVMSSFNSINGVPATANPLTLTQILRHEWKFNGLVVSDWGAVAELEKHGIGDGQAVARKALEAGTDMDMEGGLYATVIAAQVKSGAIPMSVLDEAVRRALRVKFALGLFDRPYTDARPAWQATPERRALARKVADETIVLLKNDVVGAAPLLPLPSSTGKVALIGPLADDQADLLGAWSQGNPKDVITLRTELAARLGDRLLYAPGCGLLSGTDANLLRASSTGQPAAAAMREPVPDDDRTIVQAVDIAQQADVVVLALGEPVAEFEGEAASRVDLGFPGKQQQLLEAVAATGKPVVLVVLAGRPLVLKWAASHVPSILEAWSPGMEAGPAVADILFGDANPSGKLPASLPRAVGQEPLYYAQLPTGRPATGTDLTHIPVNADEKYVSRYVDEENSALFPFGWGLSYTTFRYAAPSITRASVPLAEVLKEKTAAASISVDVTNTGARAGSEVVQLYIHNTAASVEQPVRLLKGFRRVTLAPSETRRVTFALGFNELSFLNSDLHNVVEPTTYEIFVGGSSLADAKTTLTVTR